MSFTSVVEMIDEIQLRSLSTLLEISEAFRLDIIGIDASDNMTLSM